MAFLAAFQQFQLPSGVEFCTQGSFSGPGEFNLLISKNNVLELYKLVDQGPSKV